MSAPALRTTGTTGVGVSAKGERMKAAQRNTSPHRGVGPMRRQQLIARRNVLATAWAEGISHGLPVGNLLRELSVVEVGIAEQWPRLAEARIRQWVVGDAAKLHDPDRGTHPGCSLCHQAAGRAA